MNVQTSTLANGLRVASDPMDAVETVSLGVWVEGGARQETPENNGVSHLLEHMAFKGTKRRSARDIAEEIENVGGHINAYTSRETTAYFAKVLKEDLELAVDIIADILQNPVMDSDELANERAVIIQEINQANDTPDDLVFEHFQKAAFPGQPMGRPVLGTLEVVRDLPRQDIIDFMSANYTAPRMVLAASGRITHERLADLAQSYFGGIPGGEAPAHEKPRYAGGDFREGRDLEQAHVVLGFEGVSFEDPDFYAASILSTLFGGGMSSRLFQEIREKHGLVYSIYSFLSCYKDGGVFGVYAGTGEREASRLIPLICEETLKVRGGVTEKEVARARAQLKASILMSLESTSSRTEQLARQLMVFGRPLPMEEIIRRVEEVEVSDVQQAAKRLTSATPTFAALGPISHIESFEKVAERLIADS